MTDIVDPSNAPEVDGDRSQNGLHGQTSAAERAAFEANDLGEYRSLKSDVWRQFKKHRGAVAGVIILVVITVLCFLGPIVLPLNIENDTANSNKAAGWPNIWGTDNLGRDVFVRGLLGGRISLLVGFVAMAVSIIVGVFVGVMAGYMRKLDFVLMWVTDLFLSLPLLPILLVTVVLFRDPLQDAIGDAMGIFVLMVVIIGGTSWMQTARIVRGEVLSIREQEFILASKSIGTRGRRVVLGHILPNVLSPVIVAASLNIAIAILTESAVSFLGLGFPLDLPTWGRLLNEAAPRINLNFWLVAGPGLLLALTVLSVNLIGDGLRDALDPKGRSSS